MQRSCQSDRFDELRAKSSDRSGGQNFDYTGVVTNESWKHWTDASTSGRNGRIGCDYISVNQWIGVRYITDPRPRSQTGQAEWHGSPRRFMQSQGKQEWKVARGGYNTETVDRSRGLDNNYCCIARGILKNKSQIENTRQGREQNWTKNRTRTGGTETKKQKQTQISRKERPRTMTPKRDCYQVWRASLLATQV